MLAWCSCDAPAPPKKLAVKSHAAKDVISDTHLQELFEALKGPPNAAALDLANYPPIDPLKPLLSPGDQAVWPLYAFLRGEVHRLRQDTAQAKSFHQGLCLWAAQDPYNDTWGASGLVSVSLWRWLQLAGNRPPSREAGQLIDISAKLRKTLFMEEMVEPHKSLTALPQLEEEILRALVSLSFHLPRKEEAHRFFLDYLAVARSGQMTGEEQALLTEQVAAGKISPGKVPLLLGKRLDLVGDYDGALHWLNQAMEQGDTQIKAEASYHLVRLNRFKGGKHLCASPESLERLGFTIKYGADPDLVQAALLLQAKMYIREGCPQNPEEFFKTLEELGSRFPGGRLADNALYQQAIYCLYRYWDRREEPDFYRSIRLFQSIRRFQDRDDYLDASWFWPAMAHYSRQAEGDREKAVRLLQELEKARPNGPFHLRALFWLGRLAEDAGDQARAGQYFHQIIQEMPYSYYGIRARLHLSAGPAASRQFWVDDQTDKQLAAAMRQGQAAVTDGLSLTADSPYHLRLQTALRSRLYYRSLRAFIAIKRGNETLRDQRCENLPLADLDRFHLLAPTAILLSLRQDARAAFSRNPIPDNRLKIATAIRFLPKDDPAEPYGDWPLVIYLTEAEDRPFAERAKVQKDPRFLALAYPKVLKPMVMKYSQQFGQRYPVPPELLYAMMRHLSAFYPLAFSSDKAMGLFQFSRTTFDGLDNKWNVKAEKNKRSPEDFLFDPDASIYLAARFFGEELLPRYQGDQAYSLLDYIAGIGAVREWQHQWRRIDRETDYEYLVETTPYPKAAALVRQVMTAGSVVRAAGLYQEK